MRLASLPYLLFAAWIACFCANLAWEGDWFPGATILALCASTLALLGVKLFRRTATWWGPFTTALAILGGCILVLAFLLQPGARALDEFQTAVWATVLIALAFVVAAIRLFFAWGARERKAMLWTTLASVAIPLALLAWFDATWLYPRLQQARAQVEDASLGSDPRVAALIEAELDGGLRDQVVRLVSTNARGSTMSRHFAELISVWLLPLHCDRAELRTLYASLSYVGKEEHGLPAGARTRFGRNVSELDDAQLAELVALTWAPGYLGKHPEALARRARRLQAALPGAAATSSRTPR